MTHYFKALHEARGFRPNSLLIESLRDLKTIHLHKGLIASGQGNYFTQLNKQLLLEGPEGMCDRS